MWERACSRMRFVSHFGFDWRIAFASRLTPTVDAVYSVTGAVDDRSHALRGECLKGRSAFQLWGDAERPGLHSHAERGDDQRVSNEDSCGSEPARESGLSVTVASTGGLLSRAGSLLQGGGSRLEPFVAFVEGLLDEVDEGLDFGRVLRVGVDGEPSMELHRLGE